MCHVVEFKPHRKRSLNDFCGTNRTADPIFFFCFRRRKVLASTNVLPLSSRFVTMLVLASSCLGGNREAGWNWVRNDGDAGWKAPVELSRSFKFTEAARLKPHRNG